MYTQEPRHEKHQWRGSCVIKGQCPKYCVNEKTGFRYNLLYLDSVFKYKNKLVHNQSPIMNRLCPFLLNFHQR